jgi:hypothetical protein
MRTGNIFHRDLFEFFGGKGSVDAFLLLLVTVIMPESDGLGNVVERTNLHMLW